MSQMFDGQTVEDGAIDATRWARSAGIDARCRISVKLIEAAAQVGRDRMDAEEVAARAMAILSRVRRELSGDVEKVRFVFKAGSTGTEQTLEAVFVNDADGRKLVVREV